ncbi:MAG: methyl-accepting chemotaxis protein [Halanaerobium sp.]|nr:methyl-accepting chemotaxis protein [Halanaerobium sp.]
MQKPGSKQIGMMGSFFLLLLIIIGGLAFLASWQFSGLQAEAVRLGLDSGVLQDNIYYYNLRLWLFAGGAFLVGAAFLFFYQRTARLEQEELARLAEKIAAGDFSAETIIEASGSGNIFQKMANSLREMAIKVNNSAEDVASTSRQLSQSSQDTSASVQEVAASTQQFVEATERLSNNAAGMSRLLTEINEQARDGFQLMERTRQEMQEILTTSKSSRQSINNLEKAAEEINQIVEIISGIAEQTNLLALNAAIEAARAGDQGLGFAVVADEVRDLAEETQQSAASISKLIKGLNEQTRNTVEVMETSNHLLAEGANSLDDTGRAFQVIVDKITGAGEQTSEIAAAAQEIAAGSQQVSVATEEQAVAMQEVSSSANQLSEMARDLKGLLSRFDVGGASKIGAIFPGSIQDGDYNYLGYQAMKDVAGKLGWEFVYNQKVTAAEAPGLLQKQAETGSNFIWVHGSQFNEHVFAAADRFPDTYFIIETDEPPQEKHQNIIALGRNYYLGAYVLGALAARVTRTNRIGYLGGIELSFTVGQINALKQALQEYNPAVVLDYEYTGDFNDAVLARKRAEELIGRDCDVIISGIDLGTYGLIKAVKNAKKQVYMTTLYTDKYQLAPANYLTSDLFRYAPPLLRAVDKAEQGQGGCYIPLEYGADQGRYIQLPVRNVSRQVNQEVAEIAEKVAAGEIKVEADFKNIR